MNTDDARTLFAGLLHRIAPEVDLDEVDSDAPLQEAMDLDSMDFLNLVTALHEETGIDVPERDYPALSTVAGFVAYVAAAPARA
jgi:acyl carrier protein